MLSPFTCGDIGRGLLLLLFDEAECGDDKEDTPFMAGGGGVLLLLLAGGSGDEEVAGLPAAAAEVCDGGDFGVAAGLGDEGF